MEKRVIDRTNWGAGPWDNEPDRVDFIHAGTACFILRNDSGVWCGYASVDKTHPCYGEDYGTDNFDVDVHGGLTYAGPCRGPICHVPEPGMPDDVWWFGFDCNHYMDYAPINKYMSELAGISLFQDDFNIYRDMNYVIEQTKGLAEQLAVLKSLK